MNIIEKQWILQSKQFNQLNPDLVKDIKDAYSILEKNNFTGIFKFSDEVYHHGIGIAKGKLDQFHKSPLKYYHNHCNLSIENKPEAFKIGEMVHQLILEPEKSRAKFVSDEQIYKDSGESRATKAYKTKKAELELSGKYLIQACDYDMAYTMAKNVLSHEKLQNILQNGLAERCVYAIDPETGLVMRCKPDYLLLSDGINFDLKTTADASLEEFQRSIWTYRYYVQAAYYNYVCTLAAQKEFSSFIFGCLEKEEPFDIALYYMDMGAICKGEEDMRKDLNAYANCVESDKFPGYSRDIEAISLPFWAFNK
jgi:hypothetical protein